MSRILVIGAGRASQEMIARLSRDPLVELTQAASAAQAFDSARRSPPDMAISAIDLPDIDGFTLNELWLSDERLRSIPFFFIPLNPDENAMVGPASRLASANIDTEPVSARRRRASDPPPPDSDLSARVTPHDLDFLYKTAMELVELPGQANIFQFIARRLRDLVSDALIIVSSYDQDTQIFTLESMMNIPRLLEPVLKLYGKNPEGMKFPLSEAAAQRLYNRGMDRLEMSVYDLTEGLIPRAICHQFEHILNVRSVYTMGILRGQELYGSASIFVPQDAELQHKDTIETFINQASVAIQRRNAENELSRAERKFRAVVEQSLDGIVLVDEEGLITDWNQAVEMITGLEREKALGQPIWDVQYSLNLPENQTPELRQNLKSIVMDHLWKVNAPRLGTLGEMTIRRPDNARRVLQSMVFRVQTEEGFMIGSILRDVTERRQVEEQLAAQASLNATMAEVLVRLLEATSLREITDVTLGAAQKLTGSPLGYVGYFDPQTGDLITPTITPAALEASGKENQEIVFTNFRGLYGWVIENKQSLLTNDPANDPRAVGFPARHIPVQRFLSVPALQGEALIGQISVANAGRDYTAHDQLVLERLADAYALGIQRRRVEEELRESSEGLRKTTEALRQSEEKFRTLIEQSSEGVVLVDEQGAVIEWNQAIEQISGLTREEVLGRFIWELPFWSFTSGSLQEYRHTTMKEAILEGLNTGQLPANVDTVQGSLLRPDGSLRSIEHTSFPIKTGRGYRIGTVISDITERKGAEERRAMLYQATQEISASVNREQICAAIHKAAAQVMAVDSIVITLLVNNGKEIEEVYLFDSGKQWPGERRPLGRGLSSYIIMNGRALRSENLTEETLLAEVQAIDFGVKYNLPLRAIAVPMRWGDRITGMLSVQSYAPAPYQPEDQELIEMLAAYGAIAFENAAKTASLEQEIAEHRNVQLDLERLAKTDPLTGLLNRRHFFLLAEAEFKKAARYQRSLAVIMLDTDHFKRINDLHGHTTGDRALVMLAELLRANVREVDIVARYGGEEFVILLPETSAEGAYNLAERIREQVANAVIPVGDRTTSFTISLGVADNGPACGCTKFDQILVWADKALYQAKESGRNRSVSFWELFSVVEDNGG